MLIAKYYTNNNFRISCILLMNVVSILLSNEGYGLSPRNWSFQQRVWFTLPNRFIPKRKEPLLLRKSALDDASSRVFFNKIIIYTD